MLSKPTALDGLGIPIFFSSLLLLLRRCSPVCGPDGLLARLHRWRAGILCNKCYGRGSDAYRRHCQVSFRRILLLLLLLAGLDPDYERTWQELRSAEQEVLD